MKKGILYLAVSALIVSCANVNENYDVKQFVGEWHEIMPVNKHILQGMVLAEDGEASSVGMATLQYKNWQLIQDKDMGVDIVMSGQSIGNGITIDFTDTLHVVSIKNDTLTLGKGDMYRIQYVKSDKRENLIGGSDAAKGYTYSEVLGKKIRIFEEGIRVLSATDSNATMAGYCVFSEDSSRVELFLPEIKVVLDRRVRPNGTPVWNVEDDDTFMLEYSDSKWLVTRRGKLLYTSVND